MSSPSARHITRWPELAGAARPMQSSHMGLISLRKLIPAALYCSVPVMCPQGLIVWQAAWPYKWPYSGPRTPGEAGVSSGFPG